MMIQSVHFGYCHALSVVNAGVTAEVIGGKTSDGVVQDVLGAEEFHAHDGTGDGGIGRAREDRDKAETGQEVDRSAGEGGDGIAKGCSYKEQGGDLSSLETRAERQRREQEFPEPTGGCVAAGVETGSDGDGIGIFSHDAEAEVVLCAKRVGKGDDEDAA